MTKKEKILNWVLSGAMLCIAVAAVLPLLQINAKWLPYLFAVGAGTSLVVRVLEKHSTKVLRLKRLYRMETVSALCYCVSAFFMFYPYAQQTDWLGFLTAGAALQVYSSFMIQREEKREAENKKQ